MIKKYLTCETYLENYNKGEWTTVARLDTPHHTMVTETSYYDKCFDDTGMKIPQFVDHYLVGPIADTLHAYENLGYSPEELKEIIEENKKLKEITKKVGEDKITVRFDHSSLPIDSVTTINLPDPKKNPITEVHNMAQMEQYFEDRNIKVVRTWGKNGTNTRYTFALTYAGITQNYYFTYPDAVTYEKRIKEMTKFCEGAYACFDKYVRDQVRVTYMPARQNGKSLLDAAKTFDYIEADISIQKKIYDMLNPANRIGIEDLYPSTMICPRPSTPVIKDVIFNDPATIVFWKDGTKTVVKAQGEAFDPEKGLAMAFSKKMFGNDRDYYIQFLRWLKKGKKGPERKKLEVKED